MTPGSHDIGIVGGGIGGPVTSIALHRHGRDPTIYEAADELRPVGAGISVPPNGMAVFDRLGLADVIEAQGTAIERASFQTATGRDLVEYRLSDLRPDVEHPMVMIHRGDLHEILLDRLPAESLSLGMECVGVDRDGARVTARFADGSERTHDILVGADGLRSAVRGALFPDVTLRPAGRTDYRGIAPTTLSESLRRCGREIWGGRFRFGFAPLDEGRVYWFAAVTDPSSGAEASGTKDDLLRWYRSFPDPVAELVAKTPTDDIIRTRTYDIDPPDRVWRGRTVLVGDAAHAATPDLAQGAAQAVEDGYVLADAIARHDTHRTAFEAYQSIRLPRTRRIVRESRLYGTVVHLEGGLLAGLRNVLVRLVPRPMVRRQLTRTFTPPP